jgi:hypothetical protein
VDGQNHGLFTQNLLTVWNDGAFHGNYRDFVEQIGARTRPQQNPQYKVTGSPNAAFEGEQPFTPFGAATTSLIPVSIAKQAQLPIGKNSTGSDGNGAHSIEEQLMKLLGYATPLAQSNGEKCRMQLTFPRQVIDGGDNPGILNFLKTDGVATLMKAVLAAKSIALPVDEVSGDVDCKVDYAGQVQCEGGISIRF